MLLIGAVLGGWALVALRRLDHQLIERFSGRRWEIPSKIYSDSFTVYAGSEISPLNLIERLNRLDYRRVDGEVAHAGEYRYQPAERRLEVFLRSFGYPSRFFPGFAARLEIAGQNVFSITRLDTGRTIDSLEFGPEILAGIYDQAAEERRVVKINEVPKLLVQAVLAAEDKRFFEHHGIDLRGVFRALYANVRQGRVVQGGSTLTQQLVKNFFLSGSRTLHRKITEAVMALLVELHYSKVEILETYLNEIYLGQRGSRGIFGVWEGAQFYFGKALKDLSIGEAAMLAGLIRAPGHLSPAKNPDAAKRRRAEVLRALLENGDITAEEHRQALDEPLPEREASTETTAAPYFVDYVRGEIEEQYPLNTLTSEGFRIFTTLDPWLQREAERSVSDGLAALEKRHPALTKKPEPLEAALLALQPLTGEIKAMVGGRSYARSQFNRVTSAERQPGSVFKPIVFVAALENEEQKGGREFLPTRRIADTPFTWTYDGRTWSPENYKGEYHGEVTLRQALELSLNSATARMAQEVGLDRIHAAAVRLGLPEGVPQIPAMVLGGVEVTIYEVAQAFATIANLGFRTEASAIRAVLDGEGNPVVRASLGASQAVSPRVAYLVTNLMQGVFDRGTAKAARIAGIQFPAAGKTGTTNEGRDAWFVGFTPDLLVIVWVGFDRKDVIGLSGAQAALPIWIDFMKAATAGQPVTPFLVPPGIDTVTIDPASGALATSRCPERFDESFFDGEAPVQPCPLHPETEQPATVDRLPAGGPLPPAAGSP
ncbi:MAG TPA: PBP1A family penicillin-binding protein [Candidatus Binatia bacterium]|nr:PBP1A family penicillin-binding protein [Candidatus Binatia bacterium]